MPFMDELVEVYCHKKDIEQIDEVLVSKDFDGIIMFKTKLRGSRFELIEWADSGGFQKCHS